VAHVGRAPEGPSCEHAFVSIKGGSYQRFLRALDIGNPTLVRAAAAELPQVGLEDALGICLVLLQAEPDRFPAAAARWHARLCLERHLTLHESALATAALGGLTGERPGAAVAALTGLCRSHALPGAVRRLDGWLAGRPG
jgi:hypothetical protein